MMPHDDFVWSDHLSWKWNVYLHNDMDLPDAPTIHPSFRYLPLHYHHEYLLRTKHFSKTTTKSNPCSRYQPKACKDIYMQKKISRVYQCRIPVLYSGKHLDEHISDDLPKCNESVILKMLSIPAEESGCSKSIPCEHTDYLIDGDFGFANSIGSHWDKDQSFRLVYNTPFTEHYQSSIAVDGQSLIGQVGGIMGITLGWSFLTLLELIEPILIGLASLMAAMQ